MLELAPLFFASNSSGVRTSASGKSPSWVNCDMTSGCAATSAGPISVGGQSGSGHDHSIVMGPNRTDPSRAGGPGAGCRVRRQGGRPRPGALLPARRAGERDRAGPGQPFFPGAEGLGDIVAPFGSGEVPCPLWGSSVPAFADRPGLPVPATLAVWSRLMKGR